jgi:hypothetical protein
MRRKLRDKGESANAALVARCIKTMKGAA